MGEGAGGRKTGAACALRGPAFPLAMLGFCRYSFRQGRGNTGMRQAGMFRRFP